MKMITEREIIKLIWDEYRCGKAGMKSSNERSRLRHSGHAQCALNLLAQLGEDVAEEHRFMARSFEKDISWL